ncbi:MAG: carboxypeptidase-like regulatory domain-containing protein, partial [Ignavibacteriaceae bacterium]|nr:carboxypeptidase-like regulatory domain-containing protein [Ignavibacteriaceae bacterium]
MRQKFVTLFIFPMAFLILTSQSSLPQEKMDDSDIPDILLQKISISLNNVMFETALDSIAGKCNAQLNFNRNRIPVEQVISVDMKNARAVDVLRYVLNITNTELRVSSGNQILIVPANIDKNLKGRIYGTVISSENHRPLIGANVLLDGFLLGAATDTSGKFTMDNLPVGNYTARVSYIGYKTNFIPDVIVKSDRITFLNTELKNAPILGKQVVIEGDFFSHLKVQPTSSTNYSAEEI